MFKRIGLKRLGRALGFTLIEMGIVLVVIGLILSGGLVAVAPVVQNAKINETNVKLDRIEQALIVYTIQNHCLPCPALPSEADSTGTAGQAYTTATTHSPTGCAATTCDPLVATQGVVPWVNLGLSEDDTTDAFGGRISYAVTPALVPAAGMDRVPSVSYPAGTLQVRYDGTNHVTDVAAYVLWSTGPNQAYGYPAVTGTPRRPGTTAGTFETQNSTGATYYVQAEFNTNKNTTSYFDDLLRWRSAPMIVQLCGANACGNPL